MFEENTKVSRIFGIPINPVICLATILIIILVTTTPVDIRQFLNEKKPRLPTGKVQDNSESDTITATPEMIEKAIKEIHTQKASIEEEDTTIEDISQPERYYYLVELESGRSIRAGEISITAENIVLFSENGLQTTIPRTSVSRILKVKRPVAKQAE